MNRTTFLVDGFNIYHSLRAASSELGGAQTKWLDLRALLSSRLYLIHPPAALEEIYYFSAIATHMGQYRPGVPIRHRTYLDCLIASSVIPVLGRFKYKAVRCHRCGVENPHYEEKETDVAMSMKLIELFHKDRADTIVLVTGDTDLAPAVRTGLHLYPTKHICFAFPYKRKNKELAQLVSTHLHIRKELYVAHQFSDPVVLTDGRRIRKPTGW
jgi:uncharacterized LabA/DUF88 family protein